MADTFSAAIDALFADPNFGLNATYAPPDGPPLTCKVIKTSPDREMAGLSGRPFLRGTVIEVRRSEVALPRKGGTFTIAGEVFTIDGDPMALDHDRLVWTCTVR
jgi:hypothetical protein